jgi:hypothetical protein
MVRGIQARAKMQTRRALKHQPSEKHFIPERDSMLMSSRIDDDSGNVLHAVFEYTMGEHEAFPCPFGRPGDQLWVKETFCNIAHAGYDPVYFYRADGEDKPHYVKHWKPSIFCSRKASRITLDILSLRVERLQQISEEDAIAEGAKRNDAPGEEWDGTYLTQRFIDGIEGSQNDEPHGSAREWYRSIWETINGRGSWDKNPWVWVIEFNRVEDAK